MLLIDFFSEECCKGTELIEGWYWYEDDGENVGGPYEYERRQRGPNLPSATV